VHFAFVFFSLPFYLILFLPIIFGFIFGFITLVFVHLSGGNGSLGKVRGHVALKVEVSQLLALLELKKRLQLGIRVDATAVLLVLKVVVADVGVDLTSNLGSGHLGTVGLAEELSQLLGNGGGLHEARGGAVANLAALLGAGLLGSAKLLDGVALKCAKLRAERGSKGDNLLQLGRDGGELRGDDGLSGGGAGVLGGNSSVVGSRGGRSSNGLLGSLGGLGLLSLLGGLNHLGGGSGSRGRGNSGIACGLRSLSHRIYVCLYIHY